MADTPKNIIEPFWLIESKDAYKDLYIELDAILRGIDRFFNTENLPINPEDISNKNFYHELIIVRDTILRTLGILEVVLPESKRNAYWFKKFAEAKFLSDQKRDSLDIRDNHEDPETLIFALYDSFVNFKGIISDILKAKKISYISFKNLGDVIRKEVRENNYVSPFRYKIHPDYDTIQNSIVSDIVKGIVDRKLKRSISMSLVFLFRQLRFLSCIDITTKRKISISCGLLILIMIRSEIKQMVTFFDREIKKNRFQEVTDILQPLSFSLSTELKRVYQQELRNVLNMKNVRNLRGRIENSHGILRNLIEQSIVQIVGYFDQDVPGENIFSTFLTKMAQSVKLREDIYILHKLLTLFEENMSIKTKRMNALDAIKNYMLYFENFTFKLLRYDDYEEFNKFFNDFIINIKVTPFESGGSKTLLDNVHNFRIYLETTLNHINNRTELNHIPLDVDRTKQLLMQYIQ